MIKNLNNLQYNNKECTVQILEYEFKIYFADLRHTMLLKRKQEICEIEK